MSKQLRFYFDLEDHTNLIETLRQNEDIAILKCWQSSHIAKESPSINIPTEDGFELFFCLTWRAYLDQIKSTKIPGREVWSIDIRTSPVIEFTRSYCSDNFVRQGRIFCATDFYEGDVLVRKPADFLSGVDRVFKEVRKFSKKIEGEWFGPSLASAFPLPDGYLRKR